MSDFVLIILQALLGVCVMCFFVYFLYLQIMFLKKGIRFFDIQEQEYLQHQTLTQQTSNLKSEKNG